MDRGASPGGSGGGSVGQDLRPTAPSAAPYWSADAVELARRLGSSPTGLTSADAAARLAEHGPNELAERAALSRLRVLGEQLRSPLLLILIVAAAASAITGERFDAAIVLVIVVASTGIAFSREYRAQAAIEELRSRVRTRAGVLRDGRPVTIPAREVVPGDVVLLSAGTLVPADGVLLEATYLFVNEAVLTGESFPVEKRPSRADPASPLGARTNCVFLGSDVRSGSGRSLVVATGRDTEMGAIAHRLVLRPPENEFSRGLRHFGYLLATTVLLMALVVFAVNVVLGRPPIETFLFAVALAVGLSPELLPAIISVNLARGAQLMARRGVLVRRLAAIEDLGSMDVLCTDKTGTLTKGAPTVDGGFDALGRPSDRVIERAALNAALQTGFANPMDDAILRVRRPDLGGTDKLGEVPYDFVRKRLSVVVRDGSAARLITKGAVEQVLDACARTSDGAYLDAAARGRIEERARAWTARGIRVLAVAERPLEARASYGRDDESDLELVGFLTFRDPPKADAAEAIADLLTLGVTVKIVSGDSVLVTRHVAEAVGMRVDRIVSGSDLEALHGGALLRVTEDVDLFAEVAPDQKERIIRALRATGHVVGFLGDGVNDAPAMHTADASLSVEGAVDVARDAADLVLLERDLNVVRGAIVEGRRAFANTLKYVLTTMSANLGNMASMAVASLVLPFLPLLAGQILLNNLLSDVPALGLADDDVDPELVERPRRWQMRQVARFMVGFGILSSLFDLLTFAALLGLFAAAAELFRTGWFVESLLTELVIALVVRTRRPFFRSRPGTLLLVSTLVLVPVALAIPFLPFARLLGFVPLPATLLGTLVAITAAYVVATEVVKARWYPTMA